MNLPTALDSVPSRRIAPTTMGAEGGISGTIFSRGPTMQAMELGTIATPRAASTAAIRLVTLSCSSAIRGGCDAKSSSSAS
ncbi:MAG: hypothetical protein JWL59_5013 [Chthoniobacteraceae bacterium]|nr:hypothetical protein [Chthoniobacteraceae bacterium]